MNDMKFLTVSQQKILFEIYKKDKCAIHDFVPEQFKYHSSFYRALRDMPPELLTKTMKDGQNVFKLTLDGELLVFALKTFLQWPMKFEGVD
jgi:hypothetical protein